MAIGTPVAGTLATDAVAAASIAVPYPASPTALDLLVLYVGVSNATLPTLPAGWTSAISNATPGSVSPSFRVSIKAAVGGETGTLSVTKPGSNAQAQMYKVSGVDLSSMAVGGAQDVAGQVFGSGTSTAAYSIPALVTTQAGVLLMYFGAANSATGTFTPPTVPAAFTALLNNASPIPRSGSGYLLWSGSGNTGVINLTATSARGVAGAIALRPAAVSVEPDSGFGFAA